MRNERVAFWPRLISEHPFRRRVWESQPFSVPACLLRNSITEYNFYFIFLNTPVEHILRSFIGHLDFSAVSEVLLSDEMQHNVSACPCNIPSLLPPILYEFQGFLMRHVPLFFGGVPLLVCVTPVCVCLRTTSMGVVRGFW